MPLVTKQISTIHFTRMVLSFVMINPGSVKSYAQIYFGIW